MSKLRNRSVFIALFAAIISVSSVFSIPLIPGVPIVLKDMFVVMSGALLGTFGGPASVLLYLLAGFLGLPVFANAGGIGALFSPSGGYLVGFVAASFCVGLISGAPSVTDKKIKVLYVVKIVVALFLGFIVINVLGAAKLVIFNTAPDKAKAEVFFATIAAFLPFSMLKLAIAIPVTLILRPICARYIGNVND
jgi:biotin transport system substrate-specific component